MKTALHVTPRDLEALRLLYRLHFATIRQMQAAIYHNWVVSQRRLACLSKTGLINHLGVALENRGRPLRVYFLNARKRTLLSNLTGQHLDARNLEKASALEEGRLHHLLGINTVICELYRSAKNHNLNLSFITENHRNESSPHRLHAIEDEVTDPHQRAKTIRFRRDAVFCVETPQGKGLFELEYDRGTEVIKATRPRLISIHRKAAIFLESIRSRRFQRYGRSEYFDHPFQVSRLLFITTTRARQANIVRALSDLDTRGIIYASNQDDFAPFDLVKETWQVVKQTQKPLYQALVNHHES